MEEGVEEIVLPGFDPSGEPIVRRTATGRLWLCIEFIPPMWVPDEERTGPVGLGTWAGFDQRLAQAISVPVVWEDREWFRIDEPRADTIQAIHRFLIAERRRLDPSAGAMSMDVVERFAMEAESFAKWAEFGSDSGALAARNGLLHLTRLYLAALELPASAGSNGDVPDERVDDLNWKSVFDNAGHRLPLDFYSEVFNPLSVPAEQSVVASLSDDIADIHRDIVSGLRHYRAGRRDEALWEWTFSLRSHWGEHATGAIRALHCWLAAHDSLLSAQT